MKDPQGIAHSDYSAPCPNCGSGPRRGQQVIKIGRRWWHKECRDAFRSTLREEYADP